MNRRDLLMLSSALLMPAAQAGAQPRFEPTPQDRADLARIETYLDSLRTLKAHFFQVAPNGAISQGTAWLDRPGRMRFQYDPPSPLLQPPQPPPPPEPSQLPPPPPPPPPPTVRAGRFL